jgi:hypothetical protein
MNADPNERPPDKYIRESRLYQDLYLNHRDAMYRAITFIANNGGPGYSGDTKAELIAHRDQAHAWLIAQENLDELFAAYASFVARWSPVFPEEPEQSNWA